MQAEGLCPRARAAPQVGSKGHRTEMGEKLEPRAERQSVSTTLSREHIYIFKAQNQSEYSKGTYDTFHFSFSCPGKEND